MASATSATSTIDKAAATKKILTAFDTPYGYVSGGDGQLFINNILVDECYDIQYTYREMKEPVFGYRSTHFDSMISGTVHIMGMFTVNYISDGYLYTIINADDLLLSGSTGDSTLDKALKGTKTTPTKTVNSIRSKKTLLQEYNELRKKYDIAKRADEDNTAKIEILKAQRKKIASQIKDLSEQSSAIEASADSKVEEYGEGLWYNSESRIESAKEDYNKFITIEENWAANKETLQSASNDEHITLKTTEASKSLLDAYQTIQDEFKANNSFFEEGEDTGSSTGNGTDDNFTDDEYEYLEMVQVYANNLYLWNEQYLNEAKDLASPSLLPFPNSTNYEVFKIYTDAELKKYENSVANNLLTSQSDFIDKRIKALEANKSTLVDLENEISALKTRVTQFDAGAFVTTNGDYKTLDALGFLNANAFKASSSNGNTAFLSNTTKIRPENYRKTNLTFKIFFNNKEHKVLSGVHLTGHTHMLGVGGEVIREAYQFYAKKLG
jgi:hypothetical protein